jgi:transcription initiation factor TFIIIB Brf1 subunit/transcription initiation factor TFIIB
MDDGKYERRVTLRCTTCGSDQFSYDDDDESGPVTCADCGRVTTKDELIEDNGPNIDAHVAEMGEEVMADAARELNKALRDAFKGNKNIRFNP